MNKNGNTNVITPIIIFISIIVIISMGMFFIKTIEPFIWYEKLNQISNKYIFIIEKFGYLTNQEFLELKKDLKSKGFDEENIEVDYPKVKKEYGELINFKIVYNLKLKLPIIDLVKSNNKIMNIPIIIDKYSYIKN